MIPYQDLADKYLEAQQLILAMGVVGIAMGVALWILTGRLDEVMAYMKDDGQIVRFGKWKAKKHQERQHAVYHQWAGGTVAQCKDPKCKGL